MYPRRNLRVSISVLPSTDRSRTAAAGMADESFEPTADYGVSVPQMDWLDANVPGTALTAGSLVIDKCLSRLFVAAYLLAGSAKQAEAVMLESIEQLDIKATRDGRLSWKAIARAIMLGDADSEQPPDEAPPTILPVELLRVVRLAPRLRQCFVLRILMAMPRQYCAGLLHIDARQVDENSRLAARQLANMVAGEAAN